MTVPPYKALFVHSSNELYGADIILYSLLSRRDVAKWDPHVIVPCDVPYEGRLTAKFREEGISYEEMALAVLRRKYFRPLGFPVYARNFAVSTARVLRKIRKERFEIVHSNTTAVLPGAVAAKLARVPHVWHSHEMVVSPKIVRKTTARLAPALSDVVITVSGAVRDHILRDNPKASNLRVLHNGIDIDRIAAASGRGKVREEFGFSDSDVVAGTLARISKGKGQAYLVDAAFLLKESCPNLKFLLVGDPFVGQGHLRDELEALISERGMKGRIVLSPFRTDVPDILAACDICVLPSTLPDSFPTVVLESMAASRPMVATNWGGAKEMVVDGETGFLVPVDDASVLADRLKILYDSEVTRKDMGKAAYRRASELFTLDRMAREFWDLMENVLAVERK